MAGKEALIRANRAKNDEFYTQLVDIEKELRRYKDQFRGKVVFCNCDDPYESNFFKYFAMNFNHLGLKKLITTCYSGSPIAGEQLSPLGIEWLPEDTPPQPAYKVEIVEVPDADGDGAFDLSDVEHLIRQEPNVLTLLDGDGDFRSPECIALLGEADVVVTNPPFSLFREYVAQLVEHDKLFLILGNQNAITYSEIFKLIKEDRVWLGYDNGGTKWFRVPEDYNITTESRIKVEDGIKYFSMGNINWFTNLDTTKRHEGITLYKRYTPSEFPHYDNYDAIEVSRYADTPYDFEGNMGVPITFLDKYNPEQFGILGWTRGRDEFEVRPTKRYVNARQVNPDGTESNGGKVNTGPTLLVNDRPPKCTFYVADNADGYLVQTYMRIIVRNRALGKASV
ncbi:MAG: adenine-specific methyltransferase EcoRI family protein [Coriobacteriia bacterium]|nr:adenine-specific methyltransferase EcoRI family protein [Coriobacteriia bacterium]